jgi:hypothetical protein
MKGTFSNGTASTGETTTTSGALSPSSGHSFTTGGTNSSAGQQQLGALPATPYGKYAPGASGSSGTGTGAGDALGTTAGTVKARVGQRIVVALPGAGSLMWSTPVISASKRTAPVHFLHSSGADRRGGLSASFSAVRPGTVVITATGRCTAAKAPSSISCTRGTTQWSAVVQVTNK